MSVVQLLYYPLVFLHPVSVIYYILLVILSIFIMAAPTPDTQRALRAKNRAVIKRNTCVLRINAIHALAQRTAEDNTLASQLLFAVQDLDTIWEEFIMEDNIVIDMMCELGVQAEYSGDLVVEVRDRVMFTRSIVNRYEASADESVRVASPHKGSVHQDTRYTPGSAPFASGVKEIPMAVVPSRLPEIPLPNFDGNIYMWPAFRDRFLAMVDGREQLSNIDKVYYLLGCLKGNAAEVVRGIPVSADTYKLMWSTLESRYDKPRMVANSLVEKFLNAPSLAQESLASLNKFMSTFDEGVSVLKSLHVPNLGDFMLFTLASRCLPSSCRTLFETSNHEEYPSVEALFAFIKSRITVLEHVGETAVGGAVPRTRYKEEESRRPHKQEGFRSLVSTNSTTKPSPTVCKCCSGSHSVSVCSKFKGWSVSARVKWVRDQRVCFLCLSDKHWSNQCRSKVYCSYCARKHHALIHEDQRAPSHEVPETSSIESGHNAAAALCGSANTHSVLLGTALVHIRDCTGVLHSVRALIDSASQISAMTVPCAARLGLRKTRWTAPVTGLSGTPVMNVKGLVSCTVQPRFSEEPVIPIQAWIFPSITADMPRQALSSDIAERFDHLALADPSFASPSTIDVLLGADVFSSILDGKRVSVGNELPVAFGSIFGWILIGPIPAFSTSEFHSVPVSLTMSIQTMMDRFWAVEEPDMVPEDFTDEGKCEVIFRDGHTRNADGRFSVPLPFRSRPSEEVFRGSRSAAIRRFENLERKLSHNPRLHELYTQFMSEYISLGHMSLASSPGHYFIPHHAVYKTNETTPKIRVVFDASSRSLTGMSLNTCLFTGPKLQQDVIDILLLFRLPRYAFTTDVCKMYRQILIAPSFRKYQHIFWRSSPFDQLQEFALNTVTYGVNCSPYLAMRVLQSVADNDCAEFPAVREALLTQTYVDDICTGADSEEELLSLQSALVSVLGTAGFELKKWSSNCKALLDLVPENDRACRSSSFDDCEDSSIKVLGLQWNHTNDSFCYAFQRDTLVATKRGMLSLVARIFDPLGLLAPTIFLAKHFMQRAWLSKLSWDDPLPSELSDSWSSFVSELPVLSQLKVPRFMSTYAQQRCVLCGFCDASERGYAAVIYIRVKGIDGAPVISLLGTKTKLAPIKTSTIPRLELCAATLLARWLHRIRKTLIPKLNIVDTFAWTDSSIVLSWLTVPHESFKVFVSNRIHQIHTLLPDCHWNHIRSADNPADCASRGISPAELRNHGLYWKGPACLYSPVSSWPKTTVFIPAEKLPEFKIVPPLVLISNENPEWYARFSSYDHMIRVVARMKRFIARCRRKIVSQESFLTRDDINLATMAVVGAAQQVAFSQLRQELANHQPVSSKTLARLRPFVNSQNIICVGGRLSNSDLPDAQKFPILLPKSSHLSTLIVRHWHHVTCHGGPRILCSLIGQQFWILSLRTLIRTVISKCTRCVRVAALSPQPIMADLPRSRVSECRPFSRVGIDFAGPLRMRENRLRKPREYKAYVAVFICFVVKAVHLEVVTDLTTDAFLTALDRFVARRGLPTDIYTDCGTNFVGAAKVIRNLFDDAYKQNRISTSVQCNWHFNPPSAPHFGGLWEAAVRSAKILLTKVMGEHIFTLEEFTTILTRVESILNSRPLTPASPDPTDGECLTPGHFLIGQPLLAIPDCDSGVLGSRISLTNRWKLLHQCVQAFWKRWRVEYLRTLQPRGRWTVNQPPIRTNDMVVIKEAHTPPLTWPLGRVIEVLPGTDEVVRVVKVKTQRGILVRPVVKLVKLPTI